MCAAAIWLCSDESTFTTGAVLLLGIGAIGQAENLARRIKQAQPLIFQK